MTKKHWLTLFPLIGLLMILEIVAIHETYVTVALGGNDFYPRWAGGRALLVEGRNPYSEEVTRDIISVMDPEDRGLNSFSFAYPLHAIFVFLPLAYLSYDWAIASWMVIVQWAAIATLAVLLQYHHWRPSPLILVALILATLFFYPVARSILLGQFTLHITLVVVLTMLALKQRRDWLAGLIFSLASAKPQMIVLVGVWLVLWSLRKKRFQFLGGLAVGGGVLLAASLALLPRWPIDFLSGLGQYSDLASGKEPLEVLVGLFLPSGFLWLKGLLLACLAIVTIYVWWRGLRGQISFDAILYWSIIVNLLAFFQTGTTNQVLLVIPFIAWLAEARAKRWARIVAILTGVLLVANWVLFFQTIRGDYEHPILFLPLPLLALAVILFRLSRPSLARPTSALGKRTAVE